MKIKVLIFGGAGFIGSNIANYLASKKNYSITIADNFSRGKKDLYLDKMLLEYDNISIINGDFTQNIAFDQLDKDYDYFYMLASVVGVNNTLEKPHEIIRINTLLIINTLEWLKKSEVKKVLFTSTSECYAASTEFFNFPIPTSEKVPLSILDISHPRYTYAVTKILGESGFLNYAKIFNFKCTIIRYHNVYGPRMGFKHVIPHLAERFFKNESPFVVYGSEQTRSFCYIDDAVLGTVLAMENEETNGEIFHIGTMEEITIKELVKTAGLFFDYHGPFIDAPTFPGSVDRRCPDISKAISKLGFRPKYTLQDGLNKTLEWYKTFYESGEKSFEKSFEKPKLYV